MGLWVLKVFVWYGVHEVFPKSSRTPLMKPTLNVFFFFFTLRAVDVRRCEFARS